MLLHDSWGCTLLQRHLTKKIHRILRLSTKEKEEVGEGGVSDKKKEKSSLLLFVVVVGGGGGGGKRMDIGQWAWKLHKIWISIIFFFHLRDMFIWC